MTGLNGLTAFQNLYQFRRRPTSFMASLRRDYGDVVTLWLGHKRFYFAYHPDAAKQILVDNFGNYPKSQLIFRMIRPITGSDGLVQLSGEKWADVRKKTNALFFGKNLDRYLPHLAETTDRTLSELSRAGEGGKVFEAGPRITDLVLRFSGRLLFSADFSDEAMALGEHFVQMNRICGERIRSVVYAPGFVPTRRNRYLAAQRKALDRLSREMIRDHEGSSRDLISVLKGSGDESFLVNQMLTFLFAGHEATATSILWALQLLGTHPESQERARQEVLAMGDPSAWTSQSILQMRYLGAVYKEGMRLFPPAWILAREAKERDVLLGHPVQRGATILLSLREIHRHPAFWESPEAFRPDRFLVPQPVSHPFAFLPFGAGPRICSGVHLAPFEATYILARLLAEFRFQCKSVDAVEEMITARPKEGVVISLEKLH